MNLAVGIGVEGQGLLAEYGTPGQVDAQRVADVAECIKAHWR